MSTKAKQTAIFLDELSPVEQLLWRALSTRIMAERGRGVSVRELYLQPELFSVYEGIRSRCMDVMENQVGYVFNGVHIKKGSIVQSTPMRVGVPWGNSMDERNKQREDMKMKMLN